MRAGHRIASNLSSGEVSGTGQAESFTARISGGGSVPSSSGYGLSAVAMESRAGATRLSETVIDGVPAGALMTAEVLMETTAGGAARPGGGSHAGGGGGLPGAGYQAPRSGFFAVAMDGGDVVFARFHDGVVEIYLQGACSGCPGSAATLKHGIEARLREAIPEVQAVLAL